MRLIVSLLFYLFVVTASAESIDIDNEATGIIKKDEEILLVSSTQINWVNYGFIVMLNDTGVPGSSIIGSISISCNVIEEKQNVYDSLRIVFYRNASECESYTTYISIMNTATSDVTYSVLIESISLLPASLPLESTLDASMSIISMCNVLLYSFSFSDSSLYGNEVTDTIDSVQFFITVSSATSLGVYLDSKAMPYQSTRISFDHWNSTTFSYLIDGVSSFYLSTQPLYIAIHTLEATPRIVQIKVVSTVYSTKMLLIDSSGTFEFETNVNCTESPLVSAYSNDVVYELKMRSTAYAVSSYIVNLKETVIFDSYLTSIVVSNYSGQIQVDVSRHSFHSNCSEVYSFVDNATSTRVISSQTPLYCINCYMYLRVHILQPNLSFPCSFQASLSHQHDYNITQLMHSVSYSFNTPSITSVTYLSVWIPLNDFAETKKVILYCTDIEYPYEGSSTVLPITMYIVMSSTLGVININDGSIEKRQEVFTGQSAYTISIPEDDSSICEGCYVLLAVYVEGESRMTIRPVLNRDPFLLTPNTPIHGSMSSFSNVVNLYFFLYSEEYVPITLSTVKHSTEYRSVTVLLAIDKYPSLDDYDWITTIQPQSQQTANITISRNHPKYCNKCQYFITLITSEVASVSTNLTQLTLYFDCPNNVCSSCDVGRDPKQQCNDCLDGYYGSNCAACRNCHNGVCNDKTSGDGTCICNTGFTSYSNCTECKANYYGSECKECPSCNDHGKCNEGLEGDGSCICSEYFNPAVQCADCITGRYGKDCSGVCPYGTEMVCSNHGVCDEGIDGTGRCSCSDGYVGQKCNTLFDDDACNPHCYTGNGACDEDVGECICWDEHVGVDCNYNTSEMVQLYVIMGAVVLVSILSLGFIISVKRRSKKTVKKQEERKMIIDPNGRSVSWRYVSPKPEEVKFKPSFSTINENSSYRVF